MTIAVRVSVWILGVLVVISAAIAVLTITQKQTLQGQNQRLLNQIASDESRLADLTTKVKKLEDDAVQLNNTITQTQQEKVQLQGLYDDLKHKSEALQSQLGQANTDRDDWKNRADTLSHERDVLMQKLKDSNREHDALMQKLKDRSRERDALMQKLKDRGRELDALTQKFKDRSRELDALMQKLKNLPTKIVYKDRIVQAPPTDEYWATVLRQKAVLEIEIQKEKSDLDQAALQVVNLKKQNSDLEVQIKQVSNEKDEIIQKIKYGEDLADSLSIDLARSRNDQQAVNDRADKLKEENSELLSQIRGLNSTKLDLERTVSRLTDEKDSMQKKLIETQSVIQNRIDDIWKIKEGLDKKLSENSPSSSASGSMELPPIIVNAPNQQQAQEVNPPPVSVSKTEGSIISINAANNFVIVDLGRENSPVHSAAVLKVYRNSQAIATLEVIQVRKDICAADIKDKSMELKVGDAVRF